MKKLSFATITAAAVVAASSAFAADLPAPVYKAPVAAPPPVYSWTGFYIGGNVGGAWVGNDNVTDTALGLNFGGNNNDGVFIGGGTVGVNYQFNNIASFNFVLGIEGDFDWAANNNNNSNTVFVGAAAVPFQVTNNDRWVTTVAARFGVAFDRWLVYGKAGGGWVGSNNFTVTNTATGASFSGGSNNSDGGWLAGGGVEWAFAGNWSAKIEYDYLGLNSRSFTTPFALGPIPAGDTFSTNNLNVQMVKFGINYRFGWDTAAPVTTRY